MRVEFFDVGAVVHFLRKVPWTVPGFMPEAYDAELRRLHEQIEKEGSFVSTARRLLIEARLSVLRARHDPRSRQPARAWLSWPGSPSSCCSRGCAAAA